MKLPAATGCAARSSPPRTRRIIEWRWVRDQFSAQPLALCQTGVGKTEFARVADHAPVM